MSTSLADLYPAFRERAERIVADLKAWVTIHRPGGLVRVTCTYRSQKEQDALYEQGRTMPGKIVTSTKRSLHTDCLAMDLVLIHENQAKWGDEEFWAYYGHLCRKHGVEWGGDWKKFVDRPHCQIALAPLHVLQARMWRKRRGL